MKKIILTSLVAGFMLAFNFDANAQYKNALGVRVGDAYGITFKTFLQPNKALDFILSIKNRDDFNHSLLTGLYEVHNPINGAPGLRWYYGGGATLGSLDYKNDKRDNELYLSIDGVLGLDYKVDGAPLNLSLDYKPAFVLNPYTDLDAEGFGLSVRITF